MLGGQISVVRINPYFVYANVDGEQRLVVSVDRRNETDVVVWRTADPKLPDGAKAQGSATLGSFLRWAVSMRKAQKEDVDAFEEVAFRRRWMREERRFVLKNRKQRERRTARKD